MCLLLIIADDFTGALDTGVQFAACGLETRVVVDPDVDFSACTAQVLVVDTETRHISASAAYGIVARLTERACQAGVRYLYKKTDSALRGNIGAELAAVLEASGAKSLPFLPAFPQIGRITRNGVHYVDGVPVTESPFGKDPFEPVRHASVAELIASQQALPIRSFPPLKDGDPFPQEEGILVFDAQDAQDLYSTGKCLLSQDHVRVMAGCAGFGAVLPELLGIAGGAPQPVPSLDSRLLVVCGSVNPITLAQLDYAEREGFSRLRLSPRQKLTPGYWESGEGQEDLAAIQKLLADHPRCIIESNDRGGNQPTADLAEKLGLDREGLRVRIAGSLGHLVGRLFASPHLGTLLLTGGDTLLQCMNAIGVSELKPICELEKGVVLARFSYGHQARFVITKSGGFGAESLLTDLAKRMDHSQTQPRKEAVS